MGGGVPPARWNASRYSSSSRRSSATRSSRLVRVADKKRRCVVDLREGDHQERCAGFVCRGHRVLGAATGQRARGVPDEPAVALAVPLNPFGMYSSFWMHHESDGAAGLHVVYEPGFTRYPLVRYKLMP